ncbi:PLP-dependent transferase [Martensiomyces pterosporus]|nr:PLP-dependent transferase [Martensiomyces pterosporus]
MTVPELSSGAQLALKKDSLLFRGFGLLSQNPYSAEANPEGIINAGVAANKTTTPLLLEKLNTLTRIVDEDLEYNWPHGGPALRSEIADFFNRHFSPSFTVSPDDIVVTNGCTSAIDMVTLATCEPGDHVLIPTPCYAALESDTSVRARAVPTMVDLPIEEAMSVSQIRYFEKTIKDIEARGERAKMLFLMSPHNPLGISYPKDVLRAFFEFASKHGLFVVMDEIYALSVFDRKEDVTPFESVLSWTDLDTYIDPSSVVILHGLSKDFGLNGFRMGWVLSPWNKDLTRVLTSYSPFGYRPAYTDRLITEFLSDHRFIDDMLAVSQKCLAENYQLVSSFFDSRGIRYTPCSAGHFVWFQMPVSACTRALQENELAVWENIILENRVYMPSGRAFFSNEPGWFRLTFAIDREQLELTLQRLEKACGFN